MGIPWPHMDEAATESCSNRIENCGLTWMRAAAGGCSRSGDLPEQWARTSDRNPIDKFFRIFECMAIRNHSKSGRMKLGHRAEILQTPKPSVWGGCSQRP